MTYRTLHPNDRKEWREMLNNFEKVDVCQLPEYHMAYVDRIKSAKAMIWCYEDVFCYPFLITPVQITSPDGKIYDTKYKDISSIYGYSGPLFAGNQNQLGEVWEMFDKWCEEENIIAEFTRFSIYAQTQKNAHSKTDIFPNRPSAITDLNEDLFNQLGKKTRNMIRKAEKSNLISRELDTKNGMDEFRELYDKTMSRNNATSFFEYNDKYYGALLELPEKELRLFGVFDGNKMVASAISLSHKESALYHLGASLKEYSNKGAGNLVLYHMSKTLQKDGIKFITVGGGRTTAEDDPLLRFKKSNATKLETFHIGKRIVDYKGYKEVVQIWEELYNKKIENQNLIFYR